MSDDAAHDLLMLARLLGHTGVELGIYVGVMRERELVSHERRHLGAIAHELEGHARVIRELAELELE